MNQQILEYLESNDQSTNYIGFELVSRMSMDSIADYLLYAYQEKSVSPSSYFDFCSFLENDCGFEIEKELTDDAKIIGYKLRKYERTNS